MHAHTHVRARTSYNHEGGKVNYVHDKVQNKN